MGPRPMRPVPGGSSSGAGLGAGAVVEQQARSSQDPLSNPLRGVLRAFACVPCGFFDPEGGASRDGRFCCRRCLDGGVDPKPQKYAYSTLLYGEKPQFVLGALALGRSLEATGSTHERVLLHTCDVPPEAQRLLQEFWILREVAYIASARDLHTTPYEKARFKEVFTKLQVLNPEVLPYDRVVFLDLDTLVLRNIDELFEVRPPAAMSNVKSNDGFAKSVPRHGQRMDPNFCYFNAGAMVLAPSKPLFELLSTDVQVPDPQWHRGAWSPEQSYLSLVLAGEWTHLSQIFNLEVQLHSGVPISRAWEETTASGVAVAHFSGHQKVWDCAPDHNAHVMGSEWVKQTFARLPPRTRSAVAVRCQTLHAAWHRDLAAALRHCRERGLGRSEVGGIWAEVLRTGDASALAALVGGPRRPPDAQGQPSASSTRPSPGRDRHGANGIDSAVATVSEGAIETGALAAESAPLVGDDIVLSGEDGQRRLATVLRAGGSSGGGQGGPSRELPMVCWSTPPPSVAAPFCAGPFGVCAARLAGEEVLSAEGAQSEGGADAEHDVGMQAVAWLGDGHARGLVVARRPGWRLLRFAAVRPPTWLPAEELRAAPACGAGAGDGAVGAEVGEPLQCASCLEYALGSFDGTGFWRCGGCGPRAADFPPSVL